MNCKTILAVLGTALVLSLAACGGGGGGHSGGDTPPEMQITPPDDNGDDVVLPPGHTDEPDTAAAAKAITSGQQVTGYFEEPGDVDYLRLPLSGGLNEISLELDAPEGTEITILDENGNVVHTQVVGSARSSGGSGLQPLSLQAYPLGFAVVLPAAGSYFLFRVVAPRALSAVAKWSLKATAVATAAYLIIRSELNIKVETDGKTEHNLLDYYRCRIGKKNGERGDDDSVCELEFEHESTGAVGAYTGNLPIVSVEGKTTIVTQVSCDQAGGTFEATLKIRPKIFGRTIPKVEWERKLKFEVSQNLAGCPGNDQGGPLGTVEECIAGSAALLPGGLTQAERAIAIEQIRTLCENDPDFGGGGGPGGGGSGTGKTTGDCKATAVVVINRRNSSPPCSIIGTYTRKYTSSIEPTLKDAEDEALRECRSGSRGFDYCGRGDRPANYWEAKPCTIETSICE